METTMTDGGVFYSTIRGFAEGTGYRIVYEGHCNIQKEIESLLSGFEKSLSVYDPTSIISRINRNEDIEVDNYFETVFNRAKEISKLTGGLFDISAEPLFRAWGFSSEGKNIPDKEKIEELKKYIGMDKIRIENKRLIKDHPNAVLNANAIAKGYSADIAASFLDTDCDNYLVEIGGEIRVKGYNPQGKPWSIGIDRPIEGNFLPGENGLQLILQITDKGIATSGNNRQFYIENGRKITHTINPATGYPAKHNLVSATVIAGDALTADAYATAFMVGGMEKAGQWIEENPELDAIFICDEQGEYKVYYTSLIEDKLIFE
ncbi:MAG: FAD:protein FMN transferase [Prevotella sp.]|jgi:thiamine biosynthesis lipoprotein|nr:FAD:protein FMN transferase [Prevotella sp.]